MIYNKCNCKISSNSGITNIVRRQHEEHRGHITEPRQQPVNKKLNIKLAVGWNGCAVNTLMKKQQQDKPRYFSQLFSLPTVLVQISSDYTRLHNTETLNFTNPFDLTREKEF